MSDDEFDIAATLVRRETYAPAWGVLLKPVEALLGFVPSHKDTKNGRQNAKQIRIGLVILGVAIAAFGETLPLIVAGALVMASALIVPLSKVTKGAWLGKLRRMRTQQERDARVAGAIVYDQKRLILKEGGNKLRRVLIDRGQHSVEHRQRGGSPCLGVLPRSGRKAESIWICAPEHSDRDRGVDEIGDEDVDIWARVAPNDFDSIRAVLNKLP